MIYKTILIAMLALFFIPAVHALNITLSADTIAEMNVLNITSANFRVYNDGVCTIKYSLYTPSRQIHSQLIFLPQQCTDYTIGTFVVAARQSLQESITSVVHTKYESLQRRRYRQQRDNGNGGDVLW